MRAPVHDNMGCVHCSSGFLADFRQPANYLNILTWLLIKKLCFAAFLQSVMMFSRCNDFIALSPPLI